MKIRPDQRQAVRQICGDELEAATRRIYERLAELESRQDGSSDEKLEGVRKFYEELADKRWSKKDEECLQSLGEKSESEIKQMMREAFRRSPVLPVPNFGYMVNLVKKGEGEISRPLGHSSKNPDAFPAAERERLANILETQLMEAAREIGLRLDLDNAKTAIVREELELAQGQIIGRFTPLA
jgi:hypothetical protein